jgi:phenylpyruvate tautomerase PptA (4-oxalocrotonate tautomerase family)
MPLTRVSIRIGKPPAWHRAILDGIYRALRTTFDVPDDDLFMTLSEHGPDDFAYGRHYLDIARTDDLAIIQITVSRTRTLAQKRALYAAIAANLTQTPGLRPEDVFISLVEVGPEDWSFGLGLAQKAPEA